MEVSIKAGGIVGLIYDAFLKQYRIPDIKEKDETLEQREKREHKLKSLNALCVRIVFACMQKMLVFLEREICSMIIWKHMK